MPVSIVEPDDDVIFRSLSRRFAHRRYTRHPERACGSGARFSTIDLNDLEVEGGTEKNLSFGVNWYSKTHWRFMGNLIKAWSDGPYGEQNPRIMQVKAQYYF